MNKKLLSISFASLLLTFGANAQCKVVQDSVTAGSGATEYSTYDYNVNLQLLAVATVDSNETSVTTIDSLFYNGNGQHIQVKTYNFWGGPPSLQETVDISYNGNGQISRVEIEGDNGNGPWTMAHDMTYSGGELAAIKLDPFSISGTPEGFVANFENMVWANGNLVNVDLIGDLGFGMDTLELTATYDTKNSLEAQLYVDEAPDLIGFLSQNNIVSITLDNDEVVGNAGTVAMENNYTYNANDDVTIVEELPGLFEENTSTTLYTWDCALPGVGIDEISTIETNVYPNPFNQSITISSEDTSIENGLVSIYDIHGRLIETINNVGQGSILNLEHLESGVYLFVLESKAGKSVKQLIKQ